MRCATSRRCPQFASVDRRGEIARGEPPPDAGSLLYVLCYVLQKHSALPLEPFLAAPCAMRGGGRGAATRLGAARVLRRFWRRHFLPPALARASSTAPGFVCRSTPQRCTAVLPRARRRRLFASAPRPRNRLGSLTLFNNLARQRDAQVETGAERNS